MKKLFLLICLAAIFAAVQSQTSVRASSETVGFWTIRADTMMIKKSDNIIKASIYVPSLSTDSVKITGCTFTVDGIVTNGIQIPPGQAAIDIGFNYALLDTVRIMAKGTATAWIMLFKRRN